MKTEIDKGLANHLKDLRKMREMTIKDLAEKSGYSTSHTSRIEKGERRADADYLLTVAPHLGIPQLALLKQAGYKLDSDNNFAELKPTSEMTLPDDDSYIKRVIKEEIQNGLLDDAMVEISNNGHHGIVRIVKVNLSNGGF